MKNRNRRLELKFYARIELSERYNRLLLLVSWIDIALDHL